MSKYIMNVPDEIIEFMNGKFDVLIEPKVKVGECRHYKVRLDDTEITPYPEPDEDEIRQKVEDEAWEFVRIIADMTEAQRIQCFGGSTCDLDVYLTYQEAKARYDAWKKKKGQIRVGDELVGHFGRVYVIYHIDRDKNEAYGVATNWRYPLRQETFPMHEGYTPIKTGRHFDSVERLLEEMRSE